MNTKPDDVIILDVRTKEEAAMGTIPGAVNIPVDEIQTRLAAYDGVQSGIVVPQKKETGEFFLCAYIVAAGETENPKGVAE